MIIGVPKEMKEAEYRVAMVPSGIKALVEKGHTVFVEKGAGTASGIQDEEYIDAGATLVQSAAEVYSQAELVVKVKEPLEEEYPLLKEGTTIFTFLHLATKKGLARVLLENKITAIGYETVETEKGLPILEPMSEIAGRLSVLLASYFMQKHMGGRGLLVSGVPGVERARVVIIGGGTVGLNAVRTAVGLYADVTVLDVDAERLRDVDALFPGRVTTLLSNSYNVEQAVKGGDILVGCVHIPGSRTPRIVTEDMVKGMKKGSIVIDVAVDQGGCVETIRPTTHSEPVYMLHGVLHYGVTNIPGAVPRSSTFALSNVTLPYIQAIADHGPREAIRKDRALQRGVNTMGGHITHPNVARTLGMEYGPVEMVD